MPSPSGVDMPVGDLPGWHQIFTDDFLTDVPLGSWPADVSAKWDAYPDGWTDTTGNGTYLPSEVMSQHDGVLDFFIHTNGSGQHAVSAPLPKLKAGPHSYGVGLDAGRYVVRFRADALACYKTAWLLWPDNDNWPGDGEIDFPEGSLDSTISAYLHLEGATSGDDQDAYDTSTTYTGWHTAVIEWRPDLEDTKFYLDDVLIGHSTARIPNTPMHYILQTETATSGCTPNAGVSGHVLVDWIVVYEPAVDTGAIGALTMRPMRAAATGRERFRASGAPTLRPFTLAGVSPGRFIATGALILRALRMASAAATTRRKTRRKYATYIARPR